MQMPLKSIFFFFIFNSKKNNREKNTRTHKWQYITSANPASNKLLPYLKDAK